MLDEVLFTPQEELCSLVLVSYKEKTEKSHKTPIWRSVVSSPQIRAGYFLELYSNSDNMLHHNVKLNETKFHGKLTK